MKKIFISHASEDKDEFVRPLAEALSAHYEVWFDEYVLVPGMSLLQEINRGLASSDYGVVVLSNSFFAKHWPQQELNGLFSLEEKDRKVILPVWKGLTKAEVVRYSPILADRVAAKAEDGVPKVVEELRNAITYFDRGKTVQGPSQGALILGDTLKELSEKARSESIVGSDRGVKLIAKAGQSAITIFSERLAMFQKQHPGLLRVDGPKGNEAHYFITACVGRICVLSRYYNNVINSARDARLMMDVFLNDENPWGEIRPERNIEKVQYAPFVANNDDVFWIAPDGPVYSDAQVADQMLGGFAKALKNG